MKKILEIVLLIISLFAFVILDFRYNTTHTKEIIAYIFLGALLMFFCFFKTNDEAYNKKTQCSSFIISFVLISAKFIRFYRETTVFKKESVIFIGILLSIFAFYGCYKVLNRIINIWNVKDSTIHKENNKLTPLSYAILITSLALFIFLSIDVFMERFLTMFRGHDIRFHVNRIACMAEELKIDGIRALPMRIYSSALGGYGYATPIFYGDVFLTLPALMVLFGINEYVAYKIFSLILVVTTFLSMFFVTKKVTKDTNKAILSAYFYTFSSYFATDIITRCALGESICFTFIPVVFYAWNSFFKEEKPKVLLLALSVGGILLSHIITFALTVVILFVSLCVRFPKNKKIIFSVLKSAGICIGVCAFFIFPMIEQIISQPFSITNRVEHILCRVPDIFYSVLPTNFVNYLVYDKARYLSPGLWALLPFFLLLLTKTTKLSCFSKFSKTQFWILLLGVIFVATPVSIFVDTTAGFMQFPWRMLIFTTFASSFLCADVALIKPTKIKAILCLIIPLLTFSLMVYDSALSIRLGIDYDYDFSSYRIGSQEYIPMSDALKDDIYFNAADYFYKRGDTAISDNEATKLQFSRNKNTGKLLFSEHNDDYLSVELPVTYYKGYVCEYKGEKYLPQKSYYGLSLVNIPTDEKSGEILIYYEKTIVQRVSDVITILSILLIIVFLITKKIWRYKYVKKNFTHSSLL